LPIKYSYRKNVNNNKIIILQKAEFLGTRDVQGRLIPSKESITLESWLQRNILAYGSLLANGCKSAMLLSKQPDEVSSTVVQFKK
jgi:hypothetical protein